jgi:hypothetical protein
VARKPEDLVQARVKGIYARARGVVYDTSQGYRPTNCRHCGHHLGKGAGGTRITEGLADLLVLFPGAAVWHEVKALSAKVLRPRLPATAPWVEANGTSPPIRKMPEVQLRGVLTIPSFYDRALEAIGAEARYFCYKKAQTEDQRRFQELTELAGGTYVLGGELEALAAIAAILTPQEVTRA